MRRRRTDTAYPYSFITALWTRAVCSSGVRSHEIDGLIYYGLDIPDSWRKTFIKEKRKIVGIGTAPSEHIASVNIDNFAASYELCKHIADSGRKKIYVSFRS